MKILKLNSSSEVIRRYKNFFVFIQTLFTSSKLIAFQLHKEKKKRVVNFLVSLRAECNFKLNWSCSSPLSLKIFSILCVCGKFWSGTKRYWTFQNLIAFLNSLLLSLYIRKNFKWWTHLTFNYHFITFLSIEILDALKKIPQK